MVRDKQEMKGGNIDGEETDCVNEKRLCGEERRCFRVRAT